MPTVIPRVDIVKFLVPAPLSSRVARLKALVPLVKSAPSRVSVSNDVTVPVLVKIPPTRAILDRPADLSFKVPELVRMPPERLMELVFKTALLVRLPAARLKAFAVKVPVLFVSEPMPVSVTSPATVIVPALDRNPPARLILPEVNVFELAKLPPAMLIAPSTFITEVFASEPLPENSIEVVFNVLLFISVPFSKYICEATLLNVPLLVKAAKPVMPRSPFNIKFPVLVNMPLLGVAPAIRMLPVTVRAARLLLKFPPLRETSPLTVTVFASFMIERFAVVPVRSPSRMIPSEMNLPFSRVKDLFRVTVLRSLFLVVLPAYICSSLPSPR